MAICKCGRRMSQYASSCRQCDRARAQQLRESLLPILRAGKCPRCGRALVRNLSITGWWQCEQFGAPTHRADPSQPSCDYQFIYPEEGD